MFLVVLNQFARSNRVLPKNPSYREAIAESFNGYIFCDSICKSENDAAAADADSDIFELLK